MSNKDFKYRQYKKILPRFLNLDEKDIAEKLGYDPKQLLTCYIEQNNFTICFIKVNDCIYIGCTKRNANIDQDNKTRAQKISFHRALHRNNEPVPHINVGIHPDDLPF